MAISAAIFGRHLGHVGKSPTRLWGTSLLSLSGGSSIVAESLDATPGRLGTGVLSFRRRTRRPSIPDAMNHPLARPRSTSSARIVVVTTLLGLLVTSCSSSGAPPVHSARPTADEPGTTARAQWASDTGAPAPDRQPGTASEPAFHAPTPMLPAAAPVTTLGADGERIDPVASLQALIEAGDVDLAYDSMTGYLPALLAALDIPVSSQALVFSRTSLQTLDIAPWAPRAVYFNDDVYVGMVQESPILEIASIDPDDGAVFYTLAQNEEAGPRFTREGTLCLQCHESRVTEQVPGVLVRSTLTDRMGSMVTVLHEGPVMDRTPMNERFAGWYVTGTQEGPGHAGNVWAPETHDEIDAPGRYLESFDFQAGGDVTRLDGYFDTSVYLSPHSDIVALLVLTHQTRVHNLITATSSSARDALRRQHAVLRSSGAEPPEGGLLPVTRSAVESAVERLVREMMFVDESPLGGRVTGTSGFTEEFESRGPVDRAGRSLRDLNLQDRLFEYPLSFLVYTDAFDALPGVVKRMAYQRIGEILDGRDESGVYAHVTPELAGTVREILRDTKPDFVEVVAPQE